MASILRNVNNRHSAAYFTNMCTEPKSPIHKNWDLHNFFMYNREDPVFSPWKILGHHGPELVTRNDHHTYFGPKSFLGGGSNHNNRSISYVKIQEND